MAYKKAIVRIGNTPRCRRIMAEMQRNVAKRHKEMEAERRRAAAFIRELRISRGEHPDGPFRFFFK